MQFDSLPAGGAFGASETQSSSAHECYFIKSNENAVPSEMLFDFETCIAHVYSVRLWCAQCMRNTGNVYRNSGIELKISQYIVQPYAKAARERMCMLAF